MVLEQFSGFALFFLRIVIAQIFFLHGSYKLVGKEGPRTRPYDILGIVEISSAILLFLGFLYFVSASIFIIIMLGAIFLKFFVWENQSYAGNIEYDVLLLMASFVIFILGPGAFSLNVF